MLARALATGRRPLKPELWFKPVLCTPIRLTSCVKRSFWWAVKALG